MIGILACGMVVLGVKWTTKVNYNNRMLILEMQVTDFAHVDSECLPHCRCLNRVTLKCPSTRHTVWITSSLFSNIFNMLKAGWVGSWRTYEMQEYYLATSPVLQLQTKLIKVNNHHPPLNCQGKNPGFSIKLQIPTEYHTTVVTFTSASSVKSWTAFGWFKFCSTCFQELLNYSATTNLH